MGLDPVGIIANTPKNRAANYRVCVEQLRQLLAECSAGRFNLGDRQRRIGQEFEFGVYDANGFPAPVAAQLRAAAGNPRGIEDELLRDNVEANIPHAALGTRTFSRQAAASEMLLRPLANAAQRHNLRLGMFGIGPTRTFAHTGLGWMTPSDRYDALNTNAVVAQGGVNLAIDGPTGHSLRHHATNVTPEGACNSTQFHLQVEPGEFVRLHNASQLAAGPILAACAGSPYFDGRRLWDETRIALFEGMLPGRTYLGHDWTVSLARYFLEAIEFPQLILEEPNNEWMRALKMLNGTVWRWNRACVFNDNGVRSLTIEHRYIPTGTIADNAANAAWVTGLTLYLGDVIEDLIRQGLKFDYATQNFYNAARSSLNSRLIWPNGNSFAEFTGEELVLRLLEPVGETLMLNGVSRREVEHQLAIIERRVRKNQHLTGWLTRAVDRFGLTRATQLALLNMENGFGAPVGDWESA